ncbi:MAG: putative bifunctional diguanylate cyclase/phosphodiesterase [Acidimicrobiales bacterium]
MSTRSPKAPDAFYPHYLPADLYRHYLVIALAGTGLVLGSVPTVALLAHLPVSWPVLWTGISVTAVAAVVAGWLVHGPLTDRRAGIAVLYLWTLVDIAALGAVVATSGGARSWYWVVFVLMTVFFSVGFPVRGQLAILAATLAALVLACLAGTASLDVVDLLWKVGVVMTVFVMASFPALELRRQAAEHQRARRDADALTAAMTRREAWWRSLIDRTSDPIVVFDPEWRFSFASPAFETLLGYSNKETASLDLGGIIHPDDAELVREASTRVLPDTPSRLTARLLAKDGAWHDVAISFAQVVDETDGAFVVNLHDLTERVAAESALSHQATHDALTGLANRTEFHQVVRTCLSEAAADGTPVAILVLDLENFKRVNDTIGHAAGDRLLVEMGRRLSHTLPGAHTVARLGGDEFAAVLAADGDPDGAVAAARRVLRALDEPVELDDRPYWLRGNIGVACTLGGGVSPGELMQRADRAMYEAKRTGMGVAVYESHMAGDDAERFGLLGELRRAIPQGELRLVYQPKVSPEGRLVGVEALVRWQHPVLGLLPPAAFLPAAEDSGLVRALTGWVFPTALRQLAKWLETGHEISVSVNVSAQDLADEQFPSRVKTWLEEADVEPERLILELTESSAISDYDRGTGTLAKVRSLGVQVSLDDFGTGYSSLAYLAQLPLDEIKLDRGFLESGLGTGGFLLRSIVKIGQHLGLTVVAEGVETETVLAEVVSSGCDVVQGYVFARPQPPDELDAFFDRCRQATGTTSRWQLAKDPGAGRALRRVG